jgi:hypothetical protein
MFMCFACKYTVWEVINFWNDFTYTVVKMFYFILLNKCHNVKMLE